MAEITTKGKRSIAKPDMTPLVDLGFLLITFFMYTTSFNKPVQLPYNQPVKEDNLTSDIRDSNSLTIIIGKDNELLYHRTNLENISALTSIGDSKQAFRELVINSKKEAIKSENFTVIIKPTEFSTYDGFVDVLDEMLIVNQEIYAVVDISEKEKELLL